MIKSVEFHNFRVLRKTILPLSPFTLIVGPNGSGKTTTLQALQGAARPGDFQYDRIATAGLQKDARAIVQIVINWGERDEGLKTTVRWNLSGTSHPSHQGPGGHPPSHERQQSLNHKLGRIRIYSLEANAIAAPVTLIPAVEMGHNGVNLAGVLDRLRDQEPERFKTLNEELGRWLPEFDQILFDTPGKGQRAISLRMREGHHKIQATDLSQGTLLALAILTLAYLPDPPAIVCFEEPDRGIHPRLLRDVRDALYRLSYPKSFGERREPVQLVATTHSPYFLDLFKDHPEEVVIAKRVGLEAQFERLSDLPDLQELLEDAHLGDVWYSGILGGVPSDR